ncbi:OmpA family protein [Acidocella sp. KAb 2-4]|uniref:OmpA family protein n=1 Tax=Acidocella sp. KAb 2-4 TaxID=2885158 RepID=UPI001D07287E|nr:OmpA family protein [Acidocella sp. KAb 2-4]MCB5945251.1 OmpA family protein [Acidocella sp. KAb 2-4]
MTKTVHRTAATLMCVAMLTGCSQQYAQNNPGVTSAATGAGIGAVGGALLGTLASGGHASGAVIGALGGAAAGALGGYLWNQHMEAQKQQLQQTAQGTGVQVTRTADNRLKLNVPADAGFATGSATLNPRLSPILDQLGSGLQQNPTETVQIVGYTDSTGSSDINYPLSDHRAESVKSYLVSHGVDGARITTKGMGPQDPVASNATAAGRAENRRVEIYVAFPAQQPAS